MNEPEDSRIKETTTSWMVYLGVIAFLIPCLSHQQVKEWPKKKQSCRVNTGSVFLRESDRDPKKHRSARRSPSESADLAASRCPLPAAAGVLDPSAGAPGGFVGAGARGFGAGGGGGGGGVGERGGRLRLTFPSMKGLLWEDTWKNSMSSFAFLEVGRPFWGESKRKAMLGATQTLGFWSHERTVTRKNQTLVLCVFFLNLEDQILPFWKGSTVHRAFWWEGTWLFPVALGGGPRRQ